MAGRALPTLWLVRAQIDRIVSLQPFMTPIVTVPPPASSMESSRPRRVAVVAGQPEVDAHAFIAWLLRAPALDYYRTDARETLEPFVAGDASELTDPDTLALVCHAHLPPRREALALVDHARLHHPSTRVALVLLHASRDAPRGTSAWLDAIHPDEHHHAHLDAPAHAQRITRLLARRGVALVLGSGGARGFAHLGVWESLARAGVAIDAVGGCSMGAFVAAQIALEHEPARAIERTRSIFLDNGGVFDWRLPWISLIAGDRLTGRVADLFGAHTDIEDLWLSWFCVTTSLTSADKVLHRRGRVVSAVRASSSIPGVAPPVAIDGQYHMDGGILDSLPASHARTPAIGAVIAVNVTTYSRSFAPDASAAESPLRRLMRRARLGQRGVATAFEALIAAVAIRSSHPGRRAHALAELTIEPELGDADGMDPRPFDRIVEEGRRSAAAAITSAPRASASAPPRLTDPRLADTLGAPRSSAYRIAEHDTPSLRRARAAELAALREQYVWQRGDGLPAWVAALPRAQRADRRALALAWGAFGRPARGLGAVRAGGAIPWASVLDFERAIDAASLPGGGVLQRDGEFGRRRRARAGTARIAPVEAASCGAPPGAAVCDGGLPATASIEREAAAGNLYACDYAALLDPSAVAAAALSPLVLLHGRHDGLRPLAIRLARGGDAPWFTPADGRWPWVAAKAFVEAADALYHRVVVDLYARCLWLAPFAIAARRQLHASHPVHALLAPHLDGVLARGDAARAALADAGGAPRSPREPSHDWASLARRVHAGARWPDPLPRQVPLARAAFADGERRRHALTEAYARDVVAMFYSGPVDVQIDRELQAFAADLASPAGGAVAGFPSRVATVEELSAIVTAVIFHALPGAGGEEPPGVYAPRFPLALASPPPRTRADVDEAWLLRALPRRDALARQLAAAEEITRGAASTHAAAWSDPRLAARYAAFQQAW
jgi:predicted acylesterase/phospholipase RssA